MPVILQPAKVATPALAVTVLLVHVSAAPMAGWELMPNVICAFEVVTVLPPMSSIVTTGWLARVTPLAPLAGCAVKTSWAGAPKVMANGVLVPLIGPLAVALSV